MRKSILVSLVAVVAIALGALAATLIAGSSPQLGLDLQGGVSVVLQPKEKVPSDIIDQTINIIRSRVDALGVAEPDISRQGDAVLVQLPGVKDQTRALQIVGQTAELRFRPVLDELGVQGGSANTSTTLPGATTVPGETTTAGATTVAPPSTTVGPAAPTTLGPSAPAPAATAAAATTTAAANAPTTTAKANNGPGGAVPRADASTTAAATTSPPATVAPTAAAGSGATTVAGATTVPGAGTVPGATTVAGSTPTTVTPADLTAVTPESQDDPAKTVVLLGEPDKAHGGVQEKYLLGPSVLTGSALETARATLDQNNNQWVVNVTFKGGTNGIDTFNQLASQCYSGATNCPGIRTDQNGAARGAVAIVLDGVVKSAPTILTNSFQRDQVQISGSFTHGSANDLALVLRYGALPVQLEPQTVQTVSATLGKDSLTAGIAAGITGVLLVALFMIFYYRGLGFVVLAGLCVSGALLWSIICWLGSSRGLTLTLAGATGIIVSIGVTVDSYVVYFERLKDEVRSGRSLRSSAERGFSNAYRTIFRADLVSLIAAVVLYWLTVGSVRGFAFFLGLSTLLDMFTAWFFTRPLVIMLSRTKRFAGERVLGVRTGEARFAR